MATIYNIAGTTSHSFTLGDGVTIFYGLSEPTKDMGKVGDIYVRMTKRDIEEDNYDKVESQQELQNYPSEYEQETGSALPVDTVVRLIENNTTTYYKYDGNNSWTELYGADDELGRIYYKEAFNNSSRWNFIKSYSFDELIIHAREQGKNSNDWKIELESADNSSSSTSTKANDYSVNHSAYGVTRYASDTEVIPATATVNTFLDNYKTYDANNFPTVYDNNSPDKYIAETPNQVASNIEIEMKRALKTEGKLSTLTTRTSEDLVHAINELDSDLGTVTTAMTAGTALSGKTISTGANTDITVANALSTLNTKAGVLTSLTTDEKNTLVGAINEVDAHTDTNTQNIGTITTPMATGTALAGKTIATGNNTDITVANALSTLNTAVKTNSDHIGDLGSLDTAANDLVTAINNEATTRGNADNDLQRQIDAITSKSDVVDVVANYATLAAYDTSDLGDNDVIKVLEDETDNNATTYYRWADVPTTPDVEVATKASLPAVTQSDNGHIAKVTADETHSGNLAYYECRNVNGTYEWVYAGPSYNTEHPTEAHLWDYIGQEGSYYTKSESDARYINASGDSMTGTLTLSSTGGIDATAGSITVPTQQQTDNSTKAASTAYVRSAISNEHDLVVHLADAQTITGNKTFDTGTTTTVNGSISLGSNATATTQASNDSSTKVATTAWVNDTNNNVVHKTGDETIGGNKTFNDDITFKGGYNAIMLKPTAETYSDITAQPKNATTAIGRIRFYNNENDNRIHLIPCDSSGNTGTGILLVKTDTSEYTSVIQPTDTNSTSSSQIATVGWASDSTKSTNIVHRDGTETITGAKTFTGAVNMTTMPAGTDITVKTQTQGDNSTKVASTAYVDTAITGAVGHPIPAISQSTNGQVLSNNGSAYYWKTVKDITTLAGLDDTTISTPTGGQSLVYDATTSKWINGAQTTATIRYW